MDSTKLTRTGLSWIGLLLLSFFALLSILSLEQLLRALVASLAYYIVPTGVGLLLLPSPTTWRVAGLKESERLLAAYFAGLVVLTLFYVVRDRYGFLHTHRLGIDIGALFVVVVGWRMQTRHAVSHVRLLLTSKHALLAFLVYLVGYGVQFFILSEYPRTDLFQFTHVLKATEEFLKWDRLNPFIADSYIPAIPVVLRLVTELTGAESLPTVWVLSLCSFVVRWMAIFTLIRRLPHMHRHAGLVAAVTLPFFLSGIPTNGEIVSLGGCLILGLSLASMQPPRASHSWLTLLVVPFSVGLAMVLSSAIDVALYGCFALFAGLAVRLFLIGRRGLVLFVLGLMCFLMTPLHRSVMVFFPVAVVSAAALSNLGSRYWLHPWVVKVVLVAALALVGAVLLRWLGIAFIPDLGLFLAGAAKNLLGIDFLTDANRTVGVGSKVALFEVARSVGLLLYVFGFVGLLKAQPSRNLLSYQFVAGALLLLVVLGLPFAYRAAFFLPIFLACIVIYQFCESSIKDQWLTCSALAIYAIALLVASEIVHLHGGVASAGQARIAPVLLFILLAASVSLIIMRIRRAAFITMFAVILVTATLTDRLFTRAQFMHYAYQGYRSGNLGPVSHYDQRDIAMAAALKRIPGEVVVISDPLTMANMRGLGGHNSLLLFTNLDTGSDGAKLELHRYLKNLIFASDGRGSIGCPTLDETIRVLASGHSPDLNYILLGLRSPGFSPKEILRSTGYSNSLKYTLIGRPEGIEGTPNGKSIADWDYVLSDLATRVADPVTRDTKIRFAIVMNNRTVDWVASDVPVSQTYFLMGDLPNSALFKRLEKVCPSDVTDDSAIIFFDSTGKVFNTP